MAAEGSPTRQTVAPLEITTLLIPGRNDSDPELEQLAAWCVKELGPDVPLHFSAFHPDYKLQGVPATAKATPARARRIAVDAGLRYVYTGNVHDRSGGATHCSGCARPVIERDGYEISATPSTIRATVSIAAPPSPAASAISARLSGPGAYPSRCMHTEPAEQR